MSNYLGIATVTAAFGQLIAEALQSVPGLTSAPEIRVGRPPNDPAFVGANLFLFRVHPEASRRNEDLATRDEEGRLIRLPAAALALDYIISFYGSDQLLEPHRLMGAVIALLHASPILTPQRIRATIDSAGSDSFLAGSNLDLQPDMIRFTPTSLDLETLHRVWSLFPSIPFAPSLAYSGTTVMISPDMAPVRALPAQAPVFNTTPAMPPIIDSLVPIAMIYRKTMSVTLKGRNLASGARLRFDGYEVPLIPAGSAFSAVISSNLAAGVITIRAVTGDDDAPAMSDPATLLLQPRLADGSLTVRANGRVVFACTIAPTPQFDQAVTLTLTPPSPQPPLAFATPLRFILDGSFASALNAGTIPGSLSSRLIWQGVSISSRASLEVMDPDRLWMLRDPANEQNCRLERTDDVILVHYGLPSSAPFATLCFELHGAPSGTYLASIAYSGTPDVATPLRRGVALGTPVTVSPEALETGSLPDAVRALIATDGTVLSNRFTVTQPMPGDGWEIADPVTEKTYWLSQSGDFMQVWSLNAPQGTYFGPTLTIDKAIP